MATRKGGKAASERKIEELPRELQALEERARAEETYERVEDGHTVQWTVRDGKLVSATVSALEDGELKPADLAGKLTAAMRHGKGGAR
jgi:hypothetical protein